MVIRHVALLVALLVISGCQSVGDSRSGAMVVDADNAGRTQAPHARGAEAISAAIEPEQRNRSAVGGLINDARRYLSQGLWWSAVDVAERGVRIEPREPELYGILVQAYTALGETGQAQQFARQGLRFCGSDAGVCGFLRQALSDY